MPISLHPQPASMLSNPHMMSSPPSRDLVEDVKRIVLESISLPSDLQTLCLVSRDWNYVATGYLYSMIVLNIHSCNGQLKAFENCLQRGASTRLRHVRSLNFYDTSLYQQSDLYDTSLYQQQTDPRENVVDQPSQDENVARQETILRILRQLPQNQLRTFRYISCLHLAPECIQYLDRHQQSIQDMHVTQCDPRLLINNKRRSLTAGFCNADHKTYVFAEFVKETPQLDIIWLNFLPGWTRDVARYWDSSEQTSQPLAGHTIRSSSLVISGYMPLGFTRDMPLMFDLAMVTNMFLNDFNLYVLIETLAPADALCNLVRLRCTTLDSIVPEYVAVLQDFFERNERLKHIQLSICGVAQSVYHMPDTVTSQDHIHPTSLLWPLRHRLQSLAWHDPQRTISDGSNDREALGYLCASSMESLCREFPCLQQLGVKVPDQPTISKIEHMDWKEHMLTYLEPLRNTPNLRMLQLYQDYLKPAREGIIRTKNDIASDIQGFATSLFRQAHILYPKLHVLIWGMHGAATEIDKLIAIELGDGNFEYMPQIFFVKIVERGHDGADHVYASATTRNRLRDEFPGLDMLTYDPGFRELDRQAAQM